MTVKNNVYKVSSFTELNKLGLQEAIETTEPKMKRDSARKRKSDHIVDECLDDSTAAPDFTRNDLISKPSPLNSRDAFFDKKNSRSGAQRLPDSPVGSSIDKECVLKTSKSFFNDDDCEDREANNRYSPRRSPTSFRREVQMKPLHNGANAGTPCGVVDELFTGLYGCMPSWECSLPWAEDDAEDSDNDVSERFGTLHRDTARHDAKAIREHLSFPKHLGREYISQSEEFHLEQKKRTVNRTIRRSPSSRLTTVESDSRHRLSGSKMFRRTDINRVTEIHWDEEVLDTKTLEQMAKLSVY